MDENSGMDAMEQMARNAPDISFPDIETLRREKLMMLTYPEKEIPLAPALCMDSNVWAGANHPDNPVYALFHAGTNSLVILERRGKSPWKRVELEEVDNLYGFLWKTTLNIMDLLNQRGELHDRGNRLLAVLGRPCSCGNDSPHGKIAKCEVCTAKEAWEETAKKKRETDFLLGERDIPGYSYSKEENGERSPEGNGQNRPGDDP